jgi:hypothetical protein
MLLLNLVLLIDVTFSTPTGLISSLRLYLAFFGLDERYGDLFATTIAKQ